MGGKIISEKLQGKYVNLRDVTYDDVEFILQLRCNEKKAKFLHKTDYDKEKQRAYLEKYFKLDNEWYFIIENKQQKPIGTIRIYDIHQESFCTGSWIMIDGVSSEECFEGIFLTYRYGFQTLCFNKQHIEVRKGNIKVLRFHKTMGAKSTGETELEYLFEYDRDEYMKKAALFCKAYNIDPEE